MYGKHYLWCAYVITFMKLRDIKADISINCVIIEILWSDFLPVNANHRQDGNQDSIWTRAGKQSHKIFVIYKILKMSITYPPIVWSLVDSSWRAASSVLFNSSTCEIFAK